MEGANGKHWIPVVLDLLARLIIISGFSVLLLSYPIKTGEIVILLGFAISLPVDHYRACAYSSGTNFPSATTRRLDCAATSIQAFGCCLIFAVQLSFLVTHAKSLVWLGLTGSIIVLIGGLVHALKVYKVQQLMKEVI